MCKDSFVFNGALIVDVDVDRTFIDCLRESEEGKQESASNESYCYVVDCSPCVVDSD